MNLFSQVTIDALTSLIIGNEELGIQRSGAGIERLITGCGIVFLLQGGSKKTTLYEFLAKLNLKEDDHAILRKITECAADPRQFSNAAQSNNGIDYLNQFLKPDGFELTFDEGKASLNYIAKKGLIAFKFFDFDSVDKEVKRISENLSKDPADCITAACALAEAMCRSILLEMDCPLPKDRVLTSLFKAVQDPLGLSAREQNQSTAEINVQIRTIMGALPTVVQGISALRTCAGDAHGRERGFPEIDIKTARLAVNAANTLSIFLIETWEDRMGKQLKASDS